MVVAGAAAIPAAHAQAQVQAPVGTDRRVAFDIPAQDLNGAVLAFAEKAGIRVFYDVSRVQGLRSNGVTGELTPAEALGRLLSGTGLTFRFTGDNAVELQKLGAGGLPPGVQQLDPVQVQGMFPVPPQAMIDNLPPPYAGGQVATGGQLGLLGNRPVMDTPFNQTNFTAKKAQDQQATSVRDVLIDDPSVQTFAPNAGYQADNSSIRGFSVGNLGTTYGGLFGMLPRYSIMAELAERVEVLKGPNAMLNGMNSSGIGGTINVVPKRATDDPLTRFTASYGSSAQFGGHADVGRRFGDEKQFGVRFNGVYKAGQTDVEWNTDQRALALLGLDFRGERVRVSADLGYQYQYVGGATTWFGVAAGVPLPWAPDSRSNPSGQPWAYNQRKDLFGVVRAEVDMTDSITAYAAFGAHDDRYQGLVVCCAIATTFAGATSQLPINLSEYNTFLAGEAGVRARVNTGPIGHELALTAMTYESVGGNVNVFGTPFASNLYNPTVSARPDVPTGAANKNFSSSLSSLGVADTLTAANKRIQLTAGLRLQNVASQNFNPATGQPTDGYDQSALSPAVALVFKPWDNVSLYGNFIQGLQQGTIVGPTFANAGEIFPPFVSTQYEVGVKVDWGRFTTTASLFQITQPSLISTPGPQLPTLTLSGEQRNQGLELNVFGEPIEGVRLLGGAMFLNAVLAKTPGGLTDGWIAPYSPGFSLRLAGEWDVPFVPGFTVNGRAVYTSSQYFDTTYPRRSIPNWTRFDLGARYAFENPGAKGKLLVARFNVENVLDADYWLPGGVGGLLLLSAPRTFRFSLTADF